MGIKKETYETLKTITIAVLVSSIIAFVGGVQFQKTQDKQVNSAVNSAVNQVASQSK